ncbi:hypothetical protein MCOR27_008335 [Pyricularia oryzae]|uniref:Nnf1-domain-containing protein n=3 Tax=Pyricularia TaxID=48558 RepID=A0ABQ8NBH2_PYRGI|nr:uncharacterized protein MGG_04668 [Pyricularia oryzae 70-15]KAH8837409.1 hypothetical protein MCOR01_011031 [Pyricularia oryzae]KAI6294449.1 hypothetical protein MCOR33_008423 [Pyricularia grisea]EHA53856.1 hypothetical protein MGG_04668 [Pyricularia oryzae 70-15]KAH9437913.1 hypothetical protein MCOR02_001557 [Pyricularia oryzae]KAI6255323.1 hypothetical protein MCOR19_008189 [Pyricularia oryzae]
MSPSSPRTSAPTAPEPQQPQTQQQRQAPPTTTEVPPTTQPSQDATHTHQTPATMTAPTTAPNTAAPASPPLPARHTAVAPGPRATALQQAFDEALNRTLAKLEWDKFAACYPTVSARAPNSLRSVQQRVVGLLSEKCRKEFQIILDERQVVPKLNELEALVSEAAMRRKDAGDAEPGIPPHLLPPEEVLAANLAPLLAAQQNQLNARLQTMQSHNAALFDEIQSQRAEAAALLAELDAACADVGGANALLDEVADELARETRATEVEMTGT